MSPPRPRGDDVVRLVAPAKVNLGLRVAALRGDGFHEIDTIFAALTLGDRLAVRRTDEAGVSGAIRWVGTTTGPVGPASLPPMDPSNLAWRAARVWLDASGAEGGVHVELDKVIPVAAGLGGGSSDAGAVLRALARLHPEGPDPVPLAGRLGSDVPFFVRGLAAARGRGRGERLEALELPPGDLVLVNPGVPISASEAYDALQGFGPPAPPEATVDALRRGLPPAWRNDLQPGVLRAHPVVREALDALRATDLTAPLMSGSGATCFALAADAEHAERAAADLARSHPDWWCAAASFPAAP